MKKLAVLLLTVAMTLTLAACGGNVESVDSAEATGSVESNEPKIEIADANEILTKVWDEYKASAGEDMQFPIGGGNPETLVMDAPAKFDVTLEGAKDMLTVSFCVPAENIDMTDDAATMMNMMMANNFTCGAYHVADAANVEIVISGIKDATLNNQWMCGFPEKLIIVTVGEDYVVSAFGNGMVMDAFKTAITKVYGDAAVISVEGSLVQ